MEKLYHNFSRNLGNFPNLLYNDRMYIPPALLQVPEFAADFCEKQNWLFDAISLKEICEVNDILNDNNGGNVYNYKHGNKKDISSGAGSGAGSGSKVSYGGGYGDGCGSIVQISGCWGCACGRTSY